MNKNGITLCSERIKLRQWKQADLAAFALLNQDPRVMRFFPSPLNAKQSNQLAERLKALIAEKGWGFWALELIESGEFIGFVGLNSIEVDSGIPNAPFVEIGWRIDADHWGKGYAPEAAKLALSFAFHQLKLDAVYSFTSVLNLPSQRVMQKLGMQNIEQDFEHPKLPLDHSLSKHCLYRIDANTWRKVNG